jgi:hypothetical protein
VLVASADDIIRSKTAANRSKDLDVLPQMQIDFQRALGKPRANSLSGGTANAGSLESAPMPSPVEPVSKLRGEQMRALIATGWWRGAMVLVPIAAGAVATAVVSGRNPVAVFVLAAAAVALAGVIGTFVLADSRAKSAFVRSWARSRGWTEGTGMWQDEATPLLRGGDRRNSADHVCGPLTSGGQAVLCHYTYEVRKQNVGSRGNTTTRWEAHDFTVVETSVSASGIPRLSLHPRSFGDNRLFDRIDSALTSDRVVELESAELEHEYKLEVADSASDVAVRLLFEPAFMVWCLDRAADQMLLEIENGALVVAIPDHSYDAAQLDGLVDKATTITTRLADATIEGEPA